MRRVWQAARHASNDSFESIAAHRFTLLIETGRWSGKAFEGPGQGGRSSAEDQSQLSPSYRPA